MNKRIIALGSSICMTAALVAATQTATAPLAEAASYTPSSTSYYILKYDANWAYQEGVNLGRNKAYYVSGTQSFVVILNFAAMYLSGSTWYVTDLYGPDMTLASAGEMVYQFGQGFWAGAGSDYSSTVLVGLGVNNSGGTVTSAAGAALAAQAKKSNDRFSQQNPRQSFIAGASDFEGWGYKQLPTSTAATNWITGYMNYSGRPTFLNFGSADGCSSKSYSDPCTGGLDKETIWKVSWSGSAYPTPEIYNSTLAAQWKYLSLYAYKTHGVYFSFQGMMTEQGACGSAAACPGRYNSPSDAWVQLYNQMSNFAPTVGGTVLRNPTDIMYH